VYKNKGNTHQISILFSVSFLVGIGVIMIFSSSAILAQTVFGDSFYFVKQQVLWILVGATLMCAMSFANYRILKYSPYPAVISCIILLCVVLYTPFGREIGGAKRWLYIGKVHFQPAEFVKLALVIYLAHYLARKGHLMRIVNKYYVVPLVVLICLVTLIVLQPDMGTGIMIVMLATLMFFFAGIKFLYLASAGVLIAPIAYHIVMSIGYMKNRIIAFLDPWAVAKSFGFQAIQSYIALGRGGLLGTGIGCGRQKLFYLPEPHTDFIFACIGEEVGFLGIALTVFSFFIFLWAGIHIALSSEDLFAKYLGLGIVSLVILQAIVNMGVAVGLLPITGLPLPFISFGGSSLVMNMLAVGILLSIARHG
jgi:cell division protein FtsW